MKNGTSLPSLAAKLRSFFCDNFKFQSLLRPLRIAAASEEAPPSPEEIGMFFLMDMWANFLGICLLNSFSKVFLISWRARKARFLANFWLVDFADENFVLQVIDKLSEFFALMISISS